MAFVSMAFGFIGQNDVVLFACTCRNVPCQSLSDMMSWGLKAQGSFAITGQREGEVLQDEHSSRLDQVQVLFYCRAD